VSEAVIEYVLRRVTAIGGIDGDNNKTFYESRRRNARVSKLRKP
jgi:hypothetical protein